MNAHCGKIQRMLVEYLYEELPEDRAVWVQHHVSECGICREELELCRRTLRTIDAVYRRQDILGNGPPAGNREVRCQ